MDPFDDNPENREVGFREFADSGKNKIKNILLVDNQSVSDYDHICKSVNSHTFVITYNPITTKRIELETVLKFVGLASRRIGFFFALDDIIHMPLVENESFQEPVNVDWLVRILNTLKIKTVDFFGCNTLQHETWRKYYDTLIERADVFVCANSTLTGNPDYG